MKSRVQAIRVGLIALVLILVSWAGLLGVGTGVTIDNDTFALQESFRSILGGAYHASRTSGFPAYEYLGAAISGVSGLTGVMLAALAMVIASLLLLLRPTRALRSWLGFACWALLALSPVVLTNASAIMETPLLLLGLSLMAYLLAFPGSRGWLVDIGILAVSLLLVLTRPDSILFVAATGLALLFLAQSWGDRLRKAGLLAVGVFVGLVILVLLTGKFPFQSSYLVEEPLVRRAMRGAVGFNTALSPVGFVALAVFAIMLLITAYVLVRNRKTTAHEVLDGSPLDSHSFIIAWSIAMIVVYGARFTFLADEVEYLLPLLVTVAVAVPNLRWAGKRVWIPGLIVMACVAATSVMTVSLLQRTDPWQKDPVIRPSLQAGGFIQDLRARQASSVRSSPEYRAFLAESEGPLRSGIEDGSIALVPRDTWNYVISLAYGAYYSKSNSVAACNEQTSDTLIPGWRVSQPAASYADLAAFDAGNLMTCAIVAEIEPDAVIPTEAGATALAPEGTRIPR
ncbi:MAG: hypothetical protein ACKOAF_00055 [Actinomycetes bacterium]